MTFQRTWRLVVLAAGGMSALDRVGDIAVSDPGETLQAWGDEPPAHRESQGSGVTVP
jgi:hypothetical protein